VYCFGIFGLAFYDYNKWLILLSVRQLSGGHCNKLLKTVNIIILKLYVVRYKCRLIYQFADFLTNIVQFFAPIVKQEVLMFHRKLSKSIL
jgi:hypothetical protein